jgi:NTP pyrophosphatase (non-canonical NTP hydrolase)
MTLTLGQITAEVRENNIAHGWRAPDGGICAGQTWGDYIALLHSEVSEALEAYRDYRLTDPTGFREYGQEMPESHVIKPEGVGSEFADVLIRLVDMVDVFGFDGFDPNGTLDGIPDMKTRPLFALETFGDQLAWLHFHISQMWPSADIEASIVLGILVTIARTYGIDLEAEYRRKIAYNRTRPYQHGGRTLAGEKEIENA